MNTFTLHIQDARYSVPTLQFLLCETESEARESALRYLGDSAHHIAAEVFLGQVRVRTLERADLDHEPAQRGGLRPDDPSPAHP